MTGRKDGLLVVDKSAGMTSFDVVARVRKLANMRKVGHTGTLDPDATGVLAVALGRCTKLSKYVVLDEKHYACTIKLGEATDTDDSSGEVIEEAGWEDLERSDIEAVLPRFIGEIEQTPPVYSAIKIDGKRAYARARAGEEVEMKARSVTVHDITITRWEPPFVDLEVRCGPGTYVRSLARDIGKAAGSAGHTTMIRRLGVGPFSIDVAVKLEDMTPETFWSHVLSPMEMVSTLPRLEIDEDVQQRVGFGQRIVIEGGWEIGDAVAAHDDEGHLVAVMECEDRRDELAKLRPRRVMT